MPNGAFDYTNKPIANPLAKEHQSPFVQVEVGGTTKPNFSLQTLCVEQKRTNTALTLDGKKRIGIFREIDAHSLRQVSAMPLIQICRNLKIRLSKVDRVVVGH